MTRLRRILNMHRAAILMALLTACIVALPQISFRVDHRDDGIYQGIELLPDSPWSPRAREVQDGHPNFGSIYYKDGKDDPYLFQPLGSMVVGYMGKIFSLDINNTLLLSRFILPFVVFLLMYGFVFAISRDKFAALSTAAVLLLAEAALSYFGVSHLLRGISPDDFLRIARPVNPAMIYIPFFAFLIAFWQFYRKQNWWLGALSAALLGLNFYNYFYSWTFLYAFVGVLFALLLIRKKWREAFGVASVGLGALLFVVPYVANLYQATLHPAYTETGLRFGIIESHTPLFVGWTVVAALLIFFWKFPREEREDRERYFFGLALLLAPFVTMNQQLLTGKVLQAAHYHWFFHKPIAVIFVFIVIFHIFTRHNLIAYKKALAALILAGSIAVGVFIQVNSYLYSKRDGGAVAIERQKYGPVMDWLNEHGEKEAVVLANNEASHMVVIYTSLNVFHHRAAMYSLSATRDRLLDAIFTFYRLRDISAEEARDTFFTEREFISSTIYGMHYRELLGSYEAIPDEKIEDIAALYRESLVTPTPAWLERTLAKYEVEYVIWDKDADPEWRLEQYPFLEGAVSFGDITIYKIK